IDVLVVEVERDGQVGRGEACGVYYRNETAASIAAQVEAQRAKIEASISRESLQKMFPIGGARNALDCALWDLEARASGKRAWQIAGLEKPHRLLTTFTCGVDTPEKMALKARSYPNARAIKLKLIGDAADADRVRAVREGLPEVWLGVDANQGF